MKKNDGDWNNAVGKHARALREATYDTPEFAARAEQLVQAAGETVLVETAIHRIQKIADTLERQNRDLDRAQAMTLAIQILKLNVDVVDAVTE